VVAVIWVLQRGKILTNAVAVVCVALVAIARIIEIVLGISSARRPSLGQVEQPASALKITNQMSYHYSGPHCQDSNALNLR
jgi:hypothetical protein